MTTPSRLVLGALASVVLGACGEGAMPETYQPTIALLRGNLQLPAQPTEVSEIRVALMWDADNGTDQRRHQVAQDVALTGTWPAQFEIAITAPPPAEALRPLAADAVFATGRVVAYRDGNHNEQLDLTPVDADSFVDELIAFNPHVVVSYIGYADPSGNHFLLSSRGDGFTEVDENGEAPISTPFTLLAARSPSASCHLLEWTPRTAHEAAQHSYVDPLEGNQGPWDLTLTAECPDEALPPDTMRFACDHSPAAASFMASSTTATSAFVANQCGPVMRICEKRRDLSLPPPPAWPCPCEPDGTETNRCVWYWSDL